MNDPKTAQAPAASSPSSPLTPSAESEQHDGPGCLPLILLLLVGLAATVACIMLFGRHSH